MAVKPEIYSPDYKGYLTYPAHEKINGVLLKEDRYAIYVVTIDHQSAENRIISPELKKLILESKGTIRMTQTTGTTGRTKVFDIPVSIRKISKRHKLESIRIRVTGKTVQEVIKKLDDIKAGMAEWKIEPTECIWDREVL